MATQRLSSAPFVSVGLPKKGFPSLRSSLLRICVAKAETVDKVCEIVRKQLALSSETSLTPSSAFADLGADSLDTVEIVMGLEEALDITVEEENSQNITTIQAATDLIDKLVDKRAPAA
ncbi:hypothetical protein QJS10_CPB22g00601 [Acorus calamus]|uniref:Acyl carrier protein n=1 Tax=Acorus calamus TaxID=4465 RepID=A0AAV9C2A1_ACOCL|nr:hypothetical protein QJS10_CPB22g00495 [Acorus calamus]KAK1282496.1 hypothetical protein QJS10_CPB22g00601 [Acorus calamus]